MIQSITHWMPLLDAAAKIAAIIGVVGLGFAFCQYRHSVRIAKRNERRAAVELAARECARFGGEITNQIIKLHQAIEKSGCEYLKHCKLINEESEVKLDSSGLTESDKQKIKEHLSEIVCAVNLLESFAIPFAAQVADDKIGFIECGRGFVGTFEKLFPLFCFSNLQHYYKSSQTVYWRWRKQIEKEELERQHAQAGKEFFTLSEKLIKGESNSWGAQKIASILRQAADHFSKPQ